MDTRSKVSLSLQWSFLPSFLLSSLCLMLMDDDRPLMSNDPHLVCNLLSLASLLLSVYIPVCPLINPKHPQWPLLLLLVLMDRVYEARSFTHPSRDIVIKKTQVVHAEE